MHRCTQSKFVPSTTRHIVGTEWGSSGFDAEAETVEIDIGNPFGSNEGSSPASPFLSQCSDGVCDDEFKHGCGRATDDSEESEFECDIGKAWADYESSDSDDEVMADGATSHLERVRVPRSSLLAPSLPRPRVIVRDWAL